MTAFAFDVGPVGKVVLADLEVIEIREEPDGPMKAPPEPLRWLAGDGSPAQATFARAERDGTGVAGIWRALEALSDPSDPSDEPGS